ncbi:MAG: glycosyltransferase [Patescibacteria group bacterium]
MFLSIAVTNYKANLDTLRKALKSIEEESRDFEHEIIFVDVETNKQTQEMIKKEFPEIIFLSTKKNIGFIKATNLSIQKTQEKSKYILYLNADIICKKDSIKKMIDFMEKNSKVGVCGPKLLNIDGGLQYSCFRFYKLWTPAFRRLNFLSKFSFVQKDLNRFLMKDYDRKNPFSVNWLMTASNLIRRKALEEIGSLDERFCMYFSDTDWCRRSWQKKWEVWFIPEAEMIHYHGKGSDGGLLKLFNRLTCIHIKDGIKYFLKYFIQRLKKFIKMHCA